jgi:hypothetical protein
MRRRASCSTLAGLFRSIPGSNAGIDAPARGESGRPQFQIESGNRRLFQTPIKSDYRITVFAKSYCTN